MKSGSQGSYGIGERGRIGIGRTQDVEGKSLSCARTYPGQLTEFVDQKRQRRCEAIGHIEGET